MITVQAHKIKNRKKLKTSRAEVLLTTEINAFRQRPEKPAGVGYFGLVPVKLKHSHVCVSTCLAIWAGHVEIAHNLTPNSFINAFTRFVSRHGPLVKVYSDNGTNFKGAEVAIEAALQK